VYVSILPTGLEIALNFARVRVIWLIGIEIAFHFAYVFVNLAYLALVYVSILPIVLERSLSILLVYVSIWPIGLEIAFHFAYVGVNGVDRA